MLIVIFLKSQFLKKIILKFNITRFWIGNYKGEEMTQQLVIKKNEGLTHGLKAKIEELKASGKIEVDGNIYTKEHWNAAIKTFQDINDKRKPPSKSIFTGGNGTNWHKNMIVQKGNAELSDEEINELLTSMGIKLKSEAPARPTVENVRAEGKKFLASDTPPEYNAQSTKEIEKAAPEATATEKPCTAKVDLDPHKSTFGKVVSGVEKPFVVAGEGVVKGAEYAGKETVKGAGFLVKETGKGTVVVAKGLEKGTVAVAKAPVKGIEKLFGIFHKSPKKLSEADTNELATAKAIISKAINDSDKINSKKAGKMEKDIDKIHSLDKLREYIGKDKFDAIMKQYNSTETCE